ncbi:MAG: virulence RhuM family protein [Prevotella sp.]|nr:virulence RhuM family protein [Prevotella sp.]
MEEDRGQILLYQTPDGESRIEVRLQGETVWLSLDQMAELFQRNKSTISRHIKNVFEERELSQDATVAFFATVQTEGNKKIERGIAYYNLDMIISVGYRVHSAMNTWMKSAQSYVRSWCRNWDASVPVHYIRTG